MSEKLWHTHKEVLEEAMRDPQFRADWERTALARAVAIWLCRYRAEHKLTQRQLAERLGVNHAIVGRLELGEQNPKIETLQLLATRLGVSIELIISAPAPNGEPVKEPITLRVVA